jgi:hypothetical protein
MRPLPDLQVVLSLCLDHVDEEAAWDHRGFPVQYIDSCQYSYVSISCQA